MKRLRASTATMVILLAASATGCHKSKSAGIPAIPAAPRKIWTPPPAPKPEPPPVIPAAPDLPPEQVASVIAPELLQPQPITVAPPIRRPVIRPQQGPPTPTAPTMGSVAPVAPSVPQLKPILTAAQERQLHASIDRRLERARQVVKLAGSRQLNPQQAATIQQIQTFIQQAEEEMKSDLVRADNLAERADVLSQDLHRGLP